MTSCSRAAADWEQRISQLREAHLERIPHRGMGPAGPSVRFTDGELLVFCANDYLGLANHQEVVQALCDGATHWGVGAGASRLVSGNTAAHEMVEEKTAQLVAKDRAVLFVSGYQANVGALSSLVREGDAIFSDEMVHASLIDGARLSKADVHVYRHSDMGNLAALLKTHTEYGIRLIVSDTIFSMDGDLAKLPELVDIARQHRAALYVDEAHAMGVVGPKGAGLAASLGLEKEIDIIVGTYSKAYGAAGAFVAAAEAPAAILRSQARGFLFSTGQPPALAAAVLKSLEIAAEADGLRQSLRSNIQTFVSSAKKHALPLLPSTTAIQPVMTLSNARTMAVSAHLRENGFFVQGIRPPTVKPGEARLRVTLSAAHHPTDIHRLTAAIRAALDAVPA